MGCHQSKGDDDIPTNNAPLDKEPKNRQSKALDVEDEKASVGYDENFPFIDDEKDKPKEADIQNGDADEFKPLPPLVIKEEKTESETMQVTKEKEDNIEHERVVIQKQVKTITEELHVVRMVNGEEVCDTIKEGTEEFRESGKEVLVIQEKLSKEELEGLLNDETKFDDYIKSLDQIRQLYQKKEDRRAHV